MTPPQPDFTERDKLQRDLVAACQRRAAQDGVVARLSQAAEQAKVRVDRALREVAAGGTQHSLDEAQAERRGAIEALSQARKLHAAMNAHVEETTAAIRKAEVEAYRPVMQHAARESIGACRDFQDAMGALRAAVTRKQAATAVANHAVARGAHRPFDGAELQLIANHPSRPQPPEFGLLLRTPEEEEAIWSEVL